MMDNETRIASAGSTIMYASIWDDEGDILNVCVKKGTDPDSFYSFDTNSFEILIKAYKLYSSSHKFTPSAVNHLNDMVIQDIESNCWYPMTTAHFVENGLELELGQNGKPWGKMPVLLGGDSLQNLLTFAIDNKPTPIDPTEITQKFIKCVTKPYWEDIQYRDTSKTHSMEFPASFSNSNGDDYWFNCKLAVILNGKTQKGTNDQDFMVTYDFGEIVDDASEIDPSIDNDMVLRALKNKFYLKLMERA